MNEIQLIRAQLDGERRRAMEVVDACAVALAQASPPGAPDGSAAAAFRQACAEYLACVLTWFEQRDRRAAELYPGLPTGDARRQALEPALAREGRSDEVLERLRTIEARYATPTPGPAACAAWGDLAQYMGSAWNTRRNAVDVVLAGGGRVADWRTVSGIDADSILEERSRYARVRATLPAGVVLTPRPGADG